MSTLPQFDSVFTAAENASLMLSQTRKRAREDALRTTRGLEKRLGDILAIEPLRGLPNLAPDVTFNGEPFCGLRVNAKPGSQRASKIPIDGREVLVIDKHGALVVAHWHKFHRTVLVRPVRDSEIIAEDLEHFVRVMQEALEKHVALMTQRTESLKKVEELARKIADAVGLEIR